MAQENMVSMSFRLPKPVFDWISKVAKETHRSKSFLVMECILEQLEDIEDYHDAIDAVNNRDGYMTLDEVRASFDV